MKIDKHISRTRCALGAFLLVGYTSFSGVAHGQYFHSDFDEADLASITGLSVDTPSTTGADSGTVTLNTANDQLDLTANAANMWGGA